MNVGWIYKRAREGGSVIWWGQGEVGNRVVSTRRRWQLVGAMHE